MWLVEAGAAMLWWVHLHPRQITRDTGVNRLLLWIWLALSLPRGVLRRRPSRFCSNARRWKLGCRDRAAVGAHFLFQLRDYLPKTIELLFLGTDRAVLVARSDSAMLGVRGGRLSCIKGWLVHVASRGSRAGSDW